MDFGRITTRALNKADLGLPPDPRINRTILKAAAAKKPKVYMGCAKWGRKEWIGKLYPKGTREAKFLDEYVKHYNSIELNATHYKPYSVDNIKAWAVRAKGHDFLFCPKIYKGISHFGNLANKGPLTDQFLESISGFEKHLGPVFLQLSDRFSPKRKDELFAYLTTMPKDLNLFVEVRHPDWFTQGNSTELFAQLKKLKLGAVITDTAGRRDCCHMHLTVPKTFIRFVGNSLHKTDYKRIDNWVQRIKTWLDTGLKEVYFFMHMHDEATSPELSLYLARELNRVCKLKLPVPQLLKGVKIAAAKTRD